MYKAIIMKTLIEKSIKRISNTNLDFTRFLMDRINWKRRLIGIKGARGTGKTTLMLQYIKKYIGISDEVLYVSLGNIYFAENKLVDLVGKFVRLGGKYLFLDEFHKYRNWSTEIKNIYDDFPELNTVLKTRFLYGCLGFYIEK